MVRIIISILLILFSFQSQSQIAMFHAHNQMPTVCTGNLILDDYTGAIAAYSLRKLDKDYTGFAIRVVKTATLDSAEIGFSGCYLDTVALKAFAGSDSLAVLAWYDQSGNGNTVRTVGTNRSLFPLIVIAGNIVYSSGLPAVVQTGTVVTMQKNTDFTFSSCFSVIKMDALNVINYFVGRSSGLFYGGTFGSAVGIGGFDGTNVRSRTGEDLNRHLGYFNMQGGNLFLSRDGDSPTSAGSFAASIAANTILGRPGADAGIVIEGKVQEMIFFTSEQSANVTGIKSNINTYYSIY